jgi:hypothetical protein
MSTELVFQAARSGDLAYLQALPAAALRCRNGEGLTPFLAATASGQTAVAQLLLQQGHAALDETEPNIGASGFHLAAVRAQCETLRFLLAQVGESGEK